MKKATIVLFTLAFFVGLAVLPARDIPDAATDRTEPGPIEPLSDRGQSAEMKSPQVDTDASSFVLAPGADVPGSLESLFVSGTAIRADVVMSESQQTARFPSLTDEFRQLASVGSTKVREKYADFLLAQAEVLAGTVSVDLLECGQSLCVTELRSDDYDSLDAFIEELLDRGLETKVSLQFPSAQSGVARLIFSHDPSINGVVVSGPTLFGDSDSN